MSHEIDASGWHQHPVGAHHIFAAHTDTGPFAALFGPDASAPTTTTEPAWAASSGEPEIRNPGEYHQYWFDQQHNGYCVPSSLTQVIEAQTGLPIHSYNLVEQEASQLGLPHTNLTLPEAQRLLQGFEIPAHIDYAANPQTALGELTGYLQQGRSIMLAVNASPIWYGTQDSPDNPDGHADHALIISAINPDTGTVTLSDPGTPNGNQEQVPLNTFMQAWSASYYGMLVTDDPAGGQDQQPAITAVQHLQQTPASTRVSPPAAIVLLPVALGAGWVTYSTIKNKHANPATSTRPHPATA